MTVSTPEIRGVKPQMRNFTPSDLPTLQEIRQAAFAPVFDSFRSIVGNTISSIAFTDADAKHAKLLGTFCTSTETHEIFTVTCDEEIISSVSWTDDAPKNMGEIGLTAVHPNYEGQCFGAWMFSLVLDRMKDRGVKVAIVGTGGDPSHAPARRAYEKAGFGPAIPPVYLYKAL